MSLQEVIYFLKQCQSALTINNHKHEFGSQQFEKAAIDVTNLKEQPGSDDLLEIYALFKQSTVGDVNTCEYNKRASLVGQYSFSVLFCLLKFSV